MGKRIVITTFGSYGDVHPYVGLALGLRARGHHPVLATSEYYRRAVEGEGIEFRAVRPDVDPSDRELIRRAMRPRRGTEFILRELVLPHLRDSHADLSEAARGADLLITHPITFAGSMVAERSGVRWASSVLAPASFFSAHDPTVLPGAPALVHLLRRSPVLAGAIARPIRAIARRWTAPVDRLRAELGLPHRADPLFEGQFSPELVLALFSRVLAEPQPDWPANTRVTGHIFYAGFAGERALEPALERFLDAGPPPVVFTLGTSAVGAAGSFYRESAAAARRLGVRAVLLVGREPANRPPEPLPEGIIAVEYAPHAELFPRAAAVVHQGGVGTTGQALRSGRPELVVPYSHDQPDNAHRVTRLGVARTLFPRRYSAPRLARELQTLLGDSRCARRAEEVAVVVRSEDGVAAACDAVESLLSR